MSKQGKTETIGHILFPYDPIVSAIFLREVPSNQKVIYLNGSIVSTQQVSKELQALLIEKGFVVKNSNTKHLEGRERVCGVSISVSKNYKGKTIKELLITIKAGSADELVEKKKTLLSGIQKVMPSIKCKYSTADKFVRC